MSDTTVQVTPTEPAQPTTPQAPAPEAPATGPDTEAPQEGAPEEVGDLPEWARDLIHGLRSENAARRTSESEARAALSKAKSPDEFAAVVEEMTKANKALERQLLIAKEAKDIPEVFHALLAGETAEEIRAAAEALRPQLKIAGAEPAADPNVDPRGGLTPSTETAGLLSLSGPAEVAAEARKYVRR